MCNKHEHRFSRRDFIKLGGMTLGGTILACGPGSQLVNVTASPPLSGTARPPLTLAPGEAADTILFNGNIVTIDPINTTAQALAIKDGLIVQVGSDEAIRALAGETTRQINANGRTVTPGLIDAHCHLSAYGLYGTAYIDINPPEVATIAQMQAKVAEGVASTPPGEWVIASGWISFGGRSPDKHDIDPVAPDNPVMLINQGGHQAAVNSYALELVGVDASTPDPPHGVFVRDTTGEPTGALINHPAMDYFRRTWPPDLFGVEAMERSIISPQAEFASVGVTSFQDVYARGMPRMEAYFNVARRGEMTLRGQVMNTLEYIQELDGRIADIEAMMYEDDYMHFGGAKFQVDGAALAAMTHEPHGGVAWNMSIWDPTDLNEAVAAFHDAGYQVALHTAGDAAVDMALDAIEGAMNANPRPDPRHRLEHALINTDRALQRTKDLGVVVSTQPQMIRLMADALDDMWGEERTQRLVPTRTWLDIGVPVALSSDAPSMPWIDPQTTLFASIRRYSMSGNPVSPEQALTIEEAMYAHTMGGAIAAMEEDDKGSLEPGKMADLIIWTDDPYSAETSDIVNLTVDLTMVGGEIVHEA